MTGSHAASGRHAPLAMSPEEFRRCGHELIDRVADLLQAIPERPVTPGEAPSAVREALGAVRTLPESGADAGALLGEAFELVRDHSLYNGHPRFFGYITAAPAPIGILGDLLASATNPNVGAWPLSPVASEIEAQTVRWVAELIGYDPSCGGLLVSGGNVANFVGYLAARRSKAPDVHVDGTARAGRLTSYASEEVHTWLEKACELFGDGSTSVRPVPCDAELRMDVDALRDAIREDREQGHHPMLVIGTAGTVSTGAIDPLPELATVARENGLWFHVDGAYGGLAAAVPGLSPAIEEGLPLADSVAVDPHKWLYAPLEAGCALVRDREALTDAFAHHPPYYHFGQEATNFVDMGPQNSRGFRALKVWLQLRHAGRRGYARMIADDVALSRRLHAAVAAHEELEAVTQCLSINTFRYVPGPDLSEAYLDDLNRALLGRLERSGRVFVSNAVVEGRFLLRACIVNFNTTEADVDAIPGIVAELGREVHAELGAA